MPYYTTSLKARSDLLLVTGPDGFRVHNYHRRMGTLWLGGAEGLICPKFYTDKRRGYRIS